MLNCDGNENSKEKKTTTTTTTTTTFVISELRFPPHRARGGSTQQSVVLADSALIVQSITI